MNDEYLNSGRANQKLETRKEIIASAKYFIDKGKEFTLEDVAKKAKISRATIYRYYSNVDILTSEAALDIPKDSETINKALYHLNIEERILGIQEYYNSFTIDNENAFRKYLSVVIKPNNANNKRGARRKETLQLALKDSNLKQKEKKKLSNLLTVLMGMEPLIVTKDVCGLNNQQSKELLNWGIEMILKGISMDKKL